MFPGQIAFALDQLAFIIWYNVNKQSSVFSLLARTHNKTCSNVKQTKKITNKYCKMKEIEMEKRELI